MKHDCDPKQKNTGDGTPWVAPYLPCVGWWRQWVRAGMPPLERGQAVRTHGGRVKGWRQLSHTLIDSPGGPLELTVPLCHVDLQHPTVADLRISQHGDWRTKHWHALESTYYNSPYFEYFYDDFRHVYAGNHTHLADLNEALVAAVVRLSGLDDPRLAEQLMRTDTTADAEYYQVFRHRHGFLTGLSIVDLLFNMGKECVRWM